MAKLVYIVISWLMLNLIQAIIASQENEECTSTRVFWYDYSYQQSPTFYDNHRKKCVIYIDFMCNKNADNCPANAICNMRGGIKNFGYCTCKSNFIAESDKKFCGLPSGFNETCSTDVNNPRVCDLKKTGTTCINGTCKCESGIYDMDRSQCKIRVDEFCENPRHYKDAIGCVDNAECAYEDYCKCSEGYLPTKNKLCFGIPPGGRCSAESPCYDGFICKDGTCVCPHPLGQIFDSTTTSCINLPGSECDSVHAKCIENAVCYEGRCRCDEGFYETAERKCEPLKIGFNRNCSATTCNNLEGLACIGGSCLCIDEKNLQYIKGIGCVAKHGGRCGWLPANGKENCDGANTDCKKYVVSCQIPQHCVRNLMGFWNCAV